MSSKLSHSLCIDTNCLLFAFIGVDQAIAREVDMVRGSERWVILPSIAHEEFAHNLVRWYVRETGLPVNVARQSLAAFLGTGYRVDSSNKRHREALELSLADPTLTGYDAQFLAVALHHRAEFWTADRALASKARRLNIPVRRFRPAAEPE